MLTRVSHTRVKSVSRVLPLPDSSIVVDRAIPGNILSRPTYYSLSLSFRPEITLVSAFQGTKTCR